MNILSYTTLFYKVLWLWSYLVMTVCRSGRMSRRIFMIWGSKPISSMRSASSSTLSQSSETDLTILLLHTTFSNYILTLACFHWESRLIIYLNVLKCLANKAKRHLLDISLESLWGRTLHRHMEVIEIVPPGAPTASWEAYEHKCRSRLEKMATLACGQWTQNKKEKLLKTQTADQVGDGAETDEPIHLQII